MFPLSSGWPHISQLELYFIFVLALIALQTVYTLFNFNMFQTRIYATFILIAGVIVPVVALPMPSPPQAGSSKDGSHPIANPQSPWVYLYMFSDLNCLWLCNGIPVVTRLTPIFFSISKESIPMVDTMLDMINTMTPHLSIGEYKFNGHWYSS